METTLQSVASAAPPGLLQRVTSRRGLLGALLAGGSTAAQAGGSPALPPQWVLAATPDPVREARDARERLRQRRLPNALLLDDRGRSLRFYDDVMKDRAVVLSVMYTVCSNICTPATRNLIEARRLLGEQAGGVRFVSMSLTPLSDGPAQLAAYKKLHGIGDDWTFLTGSVEQVEKVQRALGFLSERPDEDLLSHSSLALVCDERRLRWSHANTLTSPKNIARMIRFELV